jgi:hypothetical protein
MTPAKAGDMRGPASIVIPGGEPTGPAFGRPDDRLREPDPGSITKGLSV